MAPRRKNPDPSLAYLALALLLLLLPAATATSYSSRCRAPAAVADLTGEHSIGTGPPRVPPLSTGYFSGGAELLFASDSYLPCSFSFFPRRVVLTNDPTLLHLFATVTLSGFRRRGTRSHSVSFDLEGYYSTASAPAVLCMVGSGSRARHDGLGVVILPDVVLRLSLPKPADLRHPFVNGSLEGAKFRAVAVVAYADGGYSYAQTAFCPPRPPAVRDARQVLNADFSCARLRALLQSSGSYGLEYSTGHAPGSFPLRLRHRRMYVNQVYCDANGGVRALMVFYRNQSEPLIFYNHTVPSRHGFYWDEALVADGFWDSSRSRLCLRACRVVRSRPSSADWAVGECGIGMSFWFPAAWSIRDRSVVAGSIWNTSTKSNDDPARTPAVISVSRTANFMDNVSDIKYRYTRVEEAKKHYTNSKAELSKKSSREVPGNFSYHDFAFGFYLKGQGGLGHASPVTIGSALVDGDQLMADAAFFHHAVAEMNEGTLLNVSYDMRYYYEYQIAHPDLSWNASRLKSELWRISAEGVYDRETGSLCMAACIVNSTSSDCEVLVTVQFGSTEAGMSEGAVGSIISLRERTDALFFDTWSIVGYGMYMMQAAEAIERMDMESIVLVLSMALSCIFIALQLRHAKKNPDALPATSVTMLAVMALGYVIPLVLNFEAMFTSRRKNFVELTTGELLELNELTLRASTMVAFVLQLRLLQLAWSGRSSEAGKHDWSAAERSALWICLPLYLAGGVLIWIVHISDGHVHDAQVQARGLNIVLDVPRSTLPEDLLSYAGLVLDGFLLPQIILNAFSGSRVRALSPWFYAGGTVIRAMPHAYDVLRAQSYAPSWAASYVYASPRDDLFSVAWDVVVPCGAAALAVLLFLQQRLGGAFFCCLGRRRAGEYEMVSSTLSSPS